MLDSKVIIQALDQLVDACSLIDEAGACDKCPMKHTCMKEESLIDVMNFLTADRIDEMVEVSHQDHRSEEDRMASHYDNLRELWVDELLDGSF